MKAKRAVFAACALLGAAAVALMGCAALRYPSCGVWRTNTLGGPTCRECVSPPGKPYNDCLPWEAR